MKGLDKQFINIISPRLERFSWTRENIAKFRCPLCGDSQKVKSRRRGHFFYDSSIDEFRFKCFNCNEKSGWTFGPWLRAFDEQLFAEYNLEVFKEKGESRRPLQSLPSLPKVTQTKRLTQTVNRDLGMLHRMVTIADLPASHFARQYVEARVIPEKFFGLMYFSEHMRDDILEFETDPDKQPLIPNDARLVLPFWTQDGRLKIIQGRAFDPNANLRYSTVKPDENDTKIYGEDRIDRKKKVLVVEGPIDSMFLPNCLATADSDLLSADGDIYITDNQYRNREICRIVDKIIATGKQIVLWPPTLPWKDINDMRRPDKGNMSNSDLFQVISTNVYSGLKAKMRFADLRKV